MYVNIINMPETVTFKNGAKAIRLPNGQLRIISGPTKGPIGVKKGRKGGALPPPTNSFFTGKMSSNLPPLDPRARQLISKLYKK